MRYKIFISTAGIGSRVSSLTNINKALLPVKSEAVISRIINKFPKNIELVIAIGYQKNIIKDFLKIRFPKRKIKFVDIKKYKGLGSGPGFTLLQCRKYLQCPFIYSSTDTLVKEKIQLPSKNWIGISEVNETRKFLIVEKKSGSYSFIDKKKNHK